MFYSLFLKLFNKMLQNECGLLSSFFHKVNQNKQGFRFCKLIFSLVCANVAPKSVIFCDTLWIDQILLFNFFHLISSCRAIGSGQNHFSVKTQASRRLQSYIVSAYMKCQCWIFTLI